MIVCISQCWPCVTQIRLISCVCVMDYLYWANTTVILLEVLVNMISIDTTVIVNKLFRGKIGLFRNVMPWTRVFTYSTDDSLSKGLFTSDRILIADLLVGSYTSCLRLQYEQCTNAISHATTQINLEHVQNYSRIPWFACNCEWQFYKCILSNRRVYTEFLVRG